MWDAFITARKHLVIFLKTYIFVHMVLNIRDENTWHQEVFTNLFARLPNFFKKTLNLSTLVIENIYFYPNFMLSSYLNKDLVRS